MIIMENKIIAKGQFTNNVPAAIFFIFFGIICIIAATAFIPFLAGTVYCFYYSWFCLTSKKQELIVYPHSVRVKSMGNDVEIPINMISAIERHGTLSLKIKSASGKGKVSFCTNGDKIADVIRNTIINYPNYSNCSTTIEETNVSRTDNTDATLYCPYCGKKLNYNPDAKFCPYCGKQ